MTRARLSPAKTIGVFGGTFDPVHEGHLGILRAAQKHFGFDWIYVVPTAQNPLKTRGASPLRTRLARLRSALKPLDFAKLSLLEARQKKVTYTVDTLGHFHKRHPGAKLFFICGSDCLNTFNRWKNPAQILKLATLAVAHRAGFKRPSARRRFIIFPMPPIKKSSTSIRNARS